MRLAQPEEQFEEQEAQHGANRAHGQRRRSQRRISQLHAFCRLRCRRHGLLGKLPGDDHREAEDGDPEHQRQLRRDGCQPAGREGGDRPDCAGDQAELRVGLDELGLVVDDRRDQC